MKKTPFVDFKKNSEKELVSKLVELRKKLLFEKINLNSVGSSSEASNNLIGYYRKEVARCLTALSLFKKTKNNA